MSNNPLEFKVTQATPSSQHKLADLSAKTMRFWGEIENFNFSLLHTMLQRGISLFMNDTTMETFYASSKFE